MHCLLVGKEKDRIAACVEYLVIEYSICFLKVFLKLREIFTDTWQVWNNAFLLYLSSASVISDRQYPLNRWNLSDRSSQSLRVIKDLRHLQSASISIRNLWSFLDSCRDRVLVISRRRKIQDTRKTWVWEHVFMTLERDFRTRSRSVRVVQRRLRRRDSPSSTRVLNWEEFTCQSSAIWKESTEQSRALKHDSKK